MTSTLDQLRDMTVVVADTGDMEAVRALKPQDCTTNPSIVLKAVQSAEFADAFKKAVSNGTTRGDTVQDIATDLTVTVGAELSALVPGRVSTEVDASLSFDTDASVTRAQEIIAHYAKRGIEKDRILIKLAATWEGIAAAEILEKQGINCNLTLIFGFAQAVACANAGVFLISPFVGRITDWYSKANGTTYTSENDPGVQSVRDIYDYYKSAQIDTIVMGASFRNTGQIKALAGCDRLTISPALLTELSDDTETLTRHLSPNGSDPKQRIEMDQPEFRWQLCENAMATEKLSEGIRNFHADTMKLYGLIDKAMLA
ncbi:transaldolase [Parasulfitobacter algicola]|uniref:Transaldolase n=1 Tax=Parasulfitobacter algicola TaxID=2614809 RepID=A0ABX2J0L5_9RHOB|nr:transaldolase [Sulfitobacter algicola]NSX56638.1 transaldolase [Sulfitobacter algicola]